MSQAPVTTVPMQFEDYLQLPVEVLSTNRSDDLVRKSTDYLEAGVGRCWIIDPRDRVVDVYTNLGEAGGWARVTQLDEDHPTGTVDIPGAGTNPTQRG